MEITLQGGETIPLPRACYLAGTIITADGQYLKITSRREVVDVSQGKVLGKAEQILL